MSFDVKPVTAPTLNDLLRAIEAAPLGAGLEGLPDAPISISRETLSFWKANAGNAKARRRWRRRTLPNRQREVESFHAHLRDSGEEVQS